MKEKNAPEECQAPEKAPNKLFLYSDLTLGKKDTIYLLS